MEEAATKAVLEKAAVHLQVAVEQHGQRAPMAAAPTRLLRLLRAPLAALGAQPLPRVLELAVSKGADPLAFACIQVGDLIPALSNPLLPP